MTEQNRGVLLRIPEDNVITLSLAVELLETIGGLSDEDFRELVRPFHRNGERFAPLFRRILNDLDQRTLFPDYPEEYSKGLVEGRSARRKMVKKRRIQWWTEQGLSTLTSGALARFDDERGVPPLPLLQMPESGIITINGLGVKGLEEVRTWQEANQHLLQRLKEQEE